MQSAIEKYNNDPVFNSFTASIEKVLLDKVMSPQGVMEAAALACRMYGQRQGMPGYYVVNDGRAIVCLKCGFVSYNVSDVENLYCGNCKEFHCG